ncbi:hypothetical protein D9M71_831460 [compost metagenome]
MFDRSRVELFLKGLDWRRAKAVIHSLDGWQSINALAGQPSLLWSSSEWRRDSRLELIFVEPQDPGRLKQAMLACRA